MSVAVIKEWAVSPLEPIPETVEALNNLDVVTADSDLITWMTRLANRAREVVPSLTGASIARLDAGLTFTLVASSPEVAVLDAVQYAAGGPCVKGARQRGP